MHRLQRVSSLVRNATSVSTSLGLRAPLATLLAAGLLGACSSGGTSTPASTTTAPSTSATNPAPPPGATSTNEGVTSSSAPSPHTAPATAPSAPTATTSTTTATTTATSTTPSSASSEPDVSQPSNETFTSDQVWTATSTAEDSEPNDTAPSSDAATIVPDPSWACGVPDGLPPPDLGELVFEATLELGDTHEFGETPYGTRRLLDVKGGTFASPSAAAQSMAGSVLTGGLELELALSNGALELEQIDILRTSDNTLIYLRTCGFAPTSETSSRFVPDFEAPNASAYAWLNTGKFAGTRVVDAAKKTVTLAIYDIANVTLPQARVQLEDPAGVPHQPWECATAQGGRGDTVFTETVTLGGSLSVGASKRGTRNIIPITGGTVSGRLTGSVVPGGADYQLIGNSTVLDARYTLVSDAGDYVLVRNCGPFGALIPQFEARKDGPLAFLNEGNYLSSDPGGAGGGVSITFYEAQ